MTIHIPLNWHIKCFREVAEVVTGMTPAKKNPEFYGGTVPFITPSELGNNGPIMKASNYLTDAGVKKARLLPKDTILVSCIGTLGKVGIADRTIVTNQQINALIFDEEIVFPEYAYFYCKTLKPILESQAPATTIPIINKSKFSDIKIPLPPLPVQKKIAAILDAADALRQKDKALIAKYTELAQALFLEMFGDPVVNSMGWEFASFGSYIVDICAGESLSGEERPRKHGEIAVLKISAVTSGTFNPNEYKVIDPNKIKKSIITPNKGDLLFSRANTREMVGATCIVDNDYPGLCLPDKLWCLHLNDQKLAPHFVKFLLSHDGFRENLRKVATGTSGSMLNISQKKLKQLLIPLPPIELQTQFAERLEAIDQQKHQAELSLEKSEALFGSLMQRAFKGELVS